MSGTRAVRDLLSDELHNIEARRQAIFAAIAALDAACDHADTEIEPWGRWSHGSNGSLRCNECESIVGSTRDAEVTE